MSTTAGSANSGRYVDFDEYVDLKLQKTRATIKTTDILIALAGVAAMFLGYLLVFVILDQWVIPGGFGIGLRWTLLTGLLAATVGWLAWKVGRPYLRSVNRLFAAQQIEKAETGLKSNLLNLVDLKAAGREVDPGVLRALERHAAVQLQQIDVTQAIDHRPLIRTAYVLLAVVVLFCLYALFSPKKISNSIWRGLLPSADVDVATRTEILSVQPGDATVLARSTVDVHADLGGVIPEKVLLLYTTADGKFQNEPVELRADAPGQTRFKATLLGENGQGLLQDMTYVVRAGDAVSQQYRITVEQPPSATPEKVKFEFPSYMKLDPVEQIGGQIDSWEGAKVMLVARTNIPVKSAVVEFLDDPQTAVPNGEEVPMTVAGEGRRLEATWTLALRSDGTYAKHYCIQCRTESGASDPQPAVYGITIRPDLPPEVALLEPVRDLEAVANAVIPMLIQARDPDFELSRINLHVEKAGQAILNETLSETRQSRALLKHDLSLDRLGLSEGDVIEFWVEALDNRQPRANRKNTPRLKVTIVKPVSSKEAQQQLAENQKQRDQKLADAQAEQNAEQRPDQPPQDPANGEQPRDPNEPKNPDREQMPQENGEPSKDGATGKGSDSKSKGQATGDGKDSKQAESGTNQENSNDSKEKSNDSAKPDPKQGAGKQDGTSKEGQSDGKQESLSPDGEHDDKVLEKLIQKFGPKPNENAGTEKKNAGDSRNNSEDQPKQKTDGSEKDSNPEGSRPGKENTEQNQAGSKNEPGTNDKRPTQPMPNEGDPDKNNTENKNNGEPATPNPQQGPKTKGDQPKADSAKSENKKGPEGADSPKNDSNSPSQDSNDKGDMPKNSNGAENGATKDKTQTGEKNSTSKKNDGGDSKSEGDPKQDNPREQGTDSKDVIKKPGTGDEKGPAKPETDPMAKTTPKKGDGLERDPMDKPATRPGDPKNNGEAQPKNKGGQNSPNSEKRPGQPAGENKVEQQPTETGKPPRQPTTPKKEGDPNTANEPMKGEGTKDQNSQKATGGGEPNGSKSDKDGTPNNTQPGEGDKGQRPGTQQKSNSKTDNPGDSNRPGQEAKSNDKGKPSPNGTKESDSNTSSPEAREKGDNSKKPAEKQPGQNEGKKDDMTKENSPAGGEKGSPKKNDGNPPSGSKNDSGKSDEQGKGGEGDGKGQSGDSPSSAGKPSDKPGKGKAGPQGKVGGDGGQPGFNSDAPPHDGSGSATSIEESEAANLEYNKQATELVLKRLRDELERGDVDPELLKQLGWTEAEMKRFAERLGKHLEEAKAAEETPESVARRQQFEEMLKTLDLKKQGAKRSGENSPQRDVNQIESRRSNVPPQYRKAYEQFTKDLARQKQSAPASK